jgi:6-phosphofructokinase 1
MRTKLQGNAMIAQAGGPTTVINSSLWGAFSELISQLSPQSKVLGARRGINGVLSDQYVDLRSPNAESWAQIRRSPGAALGSCRKQLTADEAAQAVEHLRKLDVRYFFYIGGNDSMDTALKMSKAAAVLGFELFVAGIPKTVDNDLPCTDHCPGFGSAARYFAQSTIDLGIDIRTLPTPVSILEVMGRNAGWLAAATIVARQSPDDAPHIICVPEVPLNCAQFLSDVDAAYRRYGWVVAAVSEGVRDEQGQDWDQYGSEAADDFGHAMPGGVAAALARLVTARLKLRARYEKPGLCGRASALLASEVDRQEAEAVARFAVLRAINGAGGFMAAIVREDAASYAVHYDTVPLENVANVERKLPTEFILKNDIAVSFRPYVEPLVGGPLQIHASL